MLQTYHRHILGGDLANLSIGQGDILISPLQMAQAMGAIANGGILYQAKIVRQVQTLNNEIVYMYTPTGQRYSKAWIRDYGRSSERNDGRGGWRKRDRRRG